MFYLSVKIVTVLVISDNFLFVVQCLQCFDVVGWAAGRASGL